MPRYFFHLRDEQDVDDQEGEELPHLAAAQDFATEKARAYVCESIRQGSLNLHDYIEIADETGAGLMYVTFRETFTLAGEDRAISADGRN